MIIIEIVNSLNPIGLLFILAKIKFVDIQTDAVNSLLNLFLI
jgi:hypothetical protein